MLRSSSYLLFSFYVPRLLLTAFMLCFVLQFFPFLPCGSIFLLHTFASLLLWFCLCQVLAFFLCFFALLFPLFLLPQCSVVALVCFLLPCFFAFLLPCFPALLFVTVDSFWLLPSLFFTCLLPPRKAYRISVCFVSYSNGSNNSNKKKNDFTTRSLQQERQEREEQQEREQKQTQQQQQQQ